MTMRKDEMQDEDLKQLVREACEKESRRRKEDDASFQTLWARARLELSKKNAREEKGRGLDAWLTWIFVPMLAVFAVILMVRQPTETVPALVVELHVPSDILLQEAQEAYQMAQVTNWNLPEMELMNPEYPSDSLKWNLED
ncbi:MAG: hypothetical protein AB7P49_06590 [Bdellovibrionales bacterium]